MEGKDDEKESYEICGQDHSLWPLALQWKKLVQDKCAIERKEGKPCT